MSFTNQEVIEICMNANRAAALARFEKYIIEKEKREVEEKIIRLNHVIEEQGLIIQALRRKVKRKHQVESQARRKLDMAEVFELLFFFFFLNFSFFRRL